MNQLSDIDDVITFKFYNRLINFYIKANYSTFILKIRNVLCCI